VSATTLDQSYRACRRLSRGFGSTYYWSASVLDSQQRKHVYALYAFCRYADDLVDAGDRTPAQREAALGDFGNQFFTDLEVGRSDHPILAAVVETTRALDLPAEYFERFLRSMSMDLTVRSYDTFADLMGYMDGSAAVIGEMMVPVLRPSSEDAIIAARNLGIAFQLTNFLRDVGEDLDRDRVYIPQQTLRMYGADPWERTVTPEWAEAMKFEIARTREFYNDAQPGIAALHGRARTCIEAAHRLYGGILERIEANGYDVFGKRARVAHWRKLAVATAALRP
jgi:phytoene synthase